MTMAAQPMERPRVVILGAGFGGLMAAKSLSRANVRVTLIDRQNYHLFQPLLYQVATATLSPADIAVPIRSILRDQANADVILGSVVAVEEDETLARRASVLLREVGADNVGVTQGKLVEGRASEGPYDGILVDGAVEVLPDALIRQLRPGGYLATIERQDRISRAMLYERVGDGAARWPQFEAWAPLLPGFERKREFVF